MPIVGVNCAAPKYRRSGESHQVVTEDCLSCASSRTNSCQFTYELLASIFAQQQDRGTRISTTTLTTKCLRSEYLKRDEDYYEDPEKLWAAFRGTMYHGELERRALKGSIEEARYHAEVPGLGPISGSPDLLDPAAGYLYDYKNTKQVPTFDYAWSDHVLQLQINRWIVDHATHVEYGGETHDLSDAQVSEQFVPFHWEALVVVYMDEKGPKPITITRSEMVPKASGEGTKRARVPDIWSDEVVEEVIRQKYQAALDAFAGALPAIPEEMRGWRHPLCGYCPKFSECVDHEYADIYERSPA